MPSTPAHHVIAADAYQVPRPFRAFAVRSDEAGHAGDARAPYGRVHHVRTRFLDTASLAHLADLGFARVNVPAFADIDYAQTDFDELAVALPPGTDLLGSLAQALHATGVLGDELAAYRSCVATRIDYLACCGAGFHNDVSRHWSRCLFWVLALAVDEVEFVMPHAGVRLVLAPGDLLLFDQTMAHGLCRPADQGLAVSESFSTGANRRQIFLTGELLLSEGQWAALGAPWLPVEEHERRGALDLMVAEFDERTGAIKRPHTLLQGMKRSTCHVDETPAPA